ncbi:hypothetical protein SELMODRAFT_407512 [Selaginella moellendorffii]|uniref:Uncharacterized protein n=1 Tax=Selaginella moellendorffii TaxID=88036 RepID=D8R5V2_SELML|nr:hypothetical protein SELMODRAFT_407512 [Selaginella moellendorffii]
MARSSPMSTTWSSRDGATGLSRIAARGKASTGIADKEANLHGLRHKLLKLYHFSICPVLGNTPGLRVDESSPRDARTWEAILSAFSHLTLVQEADSVFWIMPQHSTIEPYWQRPSPGEYRRALELDLEFLDSDYTPRSSSWSSQRRRCSLEGVLGGLDTVTGNVSLQKSVVGDDVPLGHGIEDTACFGVMRSTGGWWFKSRLPRRALRERSRERPPDRGPERSSGSSC